MTYLIYKITSPTGGIYIGRAMERPNMTPTQSMKYRQKNGRGYKDSPALWNAIQKYGWDNMHKEVIQSHMDLNTANELEKILILKNSTNSYNIAAGGDGGNTYCKMDMDSLAKVKLKLSRATSGCNNPMFGRRQSPDSIRKNSIWHTDRKQSIETRLKNANSKRNRIWINDGQSERWIDKKLLNEYINQNWTIGRLKR